jgi:hypothetical protein
MCLIDEIFYSLDITGIPDGDIAFLDLYMAAYLLREPFGILFKGHRYDYDAFKNAIRNPLWPHTLTPFGMEKELIVRSMDRLSSVFEQFCKVTPINGTKRQLDPIPMLANGFAVCKATQLQRLDQREHVAQLQGVNEGLRADFVRLTSMASLDAEKIKTLEKSASERERKIQQLESQVKETKDKHRDSEAKYRDSETIRSQTTAKLDNCELSNEALKKENENLKEQNSKRTNKMGVFTLILSGFGVIGTFLTVFVPVWYSSEISELKEERDRWKSLAELTPPQQVPSQSSVDAQASSHDSSKTRILVPYLKDTQPHVDPKQPTFKQGK